MPEADAVTPTIAKSSRHARITGSFGELLILYWLSKHGFEGACLDHTGIDLIARNPQTSEVMGISVKSEAVTPARNSRQSICRRKTFLWRKRPPSAFDAREMRIEDTWQKERAV